MVYKEIIRPGDRVEMRILQKVESGKRTGEEVHVYKSQVLDDKENGNLLFSMPVENGKLRLLPLGVRYEIVFYSNGGLYRTTGIIAERYKRDNIYILEMELKAQLEKFQRREFFRYPCSLDLRFFVLNAREADMDTAEQIIASLRDENFNDKIEVGNLVDLSGGGSRFRTEREVKDTDTLLLELHLKNLVSDERYYIKAKVVHARLDEEYLQGIQYEVRVQFIMSDNKVREAIIRYIFEEERRRIHEK